LVLAAAVFGAWCAYRGISISLQAEQTLHATTFAVRLVEQFVAERGRWPASWDELERMSFDGELHGKTWPTVLSEIQSRVEINFLADPRAIAQQDAMNFSAIRPIGPHYEYRDSWWVMSLQKTIRKSVKGAGESVRPE
jgi:hypothetical protein